jgi:hypothetical protein
MTMQQPWSWRPFFAGIGLVAAGVMVLFCFTWSIITLWITWVMYS